MDEKPTYQIRNWNVHFEIAQSRKDPHHRWVAVPNRHDGKGYRRIVAAGFEFPPTAIDLFCCWNLIVQIASKTPIRGVLADEDGPLDHDDMAIQTGFPLTLFTMCVPFFLDSKMKWLEEMGAPGSTLGMKPSPARRTGTSTSGGRSREEMFNQAIIQAANQLRNVKHDPAQFQRTLSVLNDKYRDFGKDSKGKNVATLAKELVNKE